MYLPDLSPTGNRHLSVTPSGGNQLYMTSSLTGRGNAPVTRNNSMNQKIRPSSLTLRLTGPRIHCLKETAVDLGYQEREPLNEMDILYALIDCLSHKLIDMPHLTRQVVLNRQKRKPGPKARRQIAQP